MDRPGRDPIFGPRGQAREWPPKDDTSKQQSFQQTQQNQSYEPAVNPADFLVSAGDRPAESAQPSPRPQTIVPPAVPTSTPLAAQGPHQPFGTPSVPQGPPAQSAAAPPTELPKSELPNGQQSPSVTAPKAPNHEKDKKAPPNWKRIGIIGGIIAGSLAIVLIAVVLFIQFLQAPINQQNRVLRETVAAGLNTKSYIERLVVTDERQQEVLSQTRTVFFSAPDALQLHLSGIRKAGTNDTAEVFIQGDDSYVKHTVSAQTLAAANEDERRIYDLAQNRWLQVVKDGQPLTSPVIRQMGSQDVLNGQRLLQPAPFVLGLFTPEQQQELNSFVDLNNAYTPASSSPTNDIIDATDTVRFSVAVNTDVVRELNRATSEMLDATPSTQFEDQLQQMPQTLEIWAARSNSQLVQYTYPSGNLTTRIQYSSVNADVDLPVLGDAVLPEDADQQVADGVQRDVMEEVSEVMIARRDEGVAFPPDRQTFIAYTRQQIDDDLRSRISIQFATGTPELYDVFYRPSSLCSADHRSVTPNEDPATFTLFTTLASGPYCIDNSPDEEEEE